MGRSDFESLSEDETSYTSSGDETSYTSSEDETSSASKRKKIEENTDRISELPDSILVNHILTLLPDSESAIRTGILSKRWQFLWTSIPVLRFCYPDSSRKPISNFINFVDKTLIQCRYSKLNKFTVDISKDHRGVSVPSLEAWICYAVGCNVEELRIDMPYYSKYKLPVHLFENSFVSNLTLQDCELTPMGQVSWPMLKKLSIWGGSVPNELIENILLGSPMLESLEFRECDGCAGINISSASLKDLVLNGYTFYRGDRTRFYRDRFCLEISGPNLLSLDIKGYISAKKVVLHSLPSLVKLCLDFYDGFDEDYLKDPNMWLEIFENISHVQQLAVGNLAMKVLSSLELDGQSSPLSKRTLLKMNFMDRSYFPGLANLLQSSPLLERLLINLPQQLSELDSSYTRRNFLTYHNRSFQCLQNHLKFVKICYFYEDDRYHECELGRFLLENASILEEMIICVGSCCPQSSSESQSMIRLHEAEKYLSFRRASKNAVVLIKDLKVHYRRYGTV